MKLTEEDYYNMLKKIENNSIDKENSVNKKNNKKIVSPLKTDKAKQKNTTAIKQKKIITSIQHCNIKTNITNNGVGLYYEGARLYTLNEMFAMLQYHKFNIFSYKKKCHHLVERTKIQLNYEYPNKNVFFKPPLKVFLYRESTKIVDNDSLPAMYKYIIDGIVKNFCEIIDDNPQIIVNYIPLQEKSKNHGVGLFFEEIKERPKIDKKQLFGI